MRNRMEWRGLLPVLIIAIAATLAGSQGNKGGGKGGGGNGGGGLPATPDLAYQGSNKGRAAIYLLDSRTGEAGVLVNGQGAAWSADGTRIAFVRTSGSLGIWIKNADGSGNEWMLVPIRDGFMLDIWGLDWTRATAPTGREMIIYDEEIANGNTVIHAINTDGTGKVQLTNGELTMDPKWSPDGTRFVAMESTSLWDGLIICQLGMSNNTLVVTGTTRIPNPVTGPGYNYLMQADWSNSGNWIVATIRHGDQYDLWRIDANNPANAVRLTYTPNQDEREPCFSADDSKVFFHMKLKKKWQLYSIDAITGVNQRLISGDNEEALGPAPRRDTP